MQLKHQGRALIKQKSLEAWIATLRSGQLQGTWKGLLRKLQGRSRRRLY